MWNTYLDWPIRLCAGWGAKGNSDEMEFYDKATSFVGRLGVISCLVAHS